MNNVTQTCRITIESHHCIECENLWEAARLLAANPTLVSRYTLIHAAKDGWYVAIASQEKPNGEWLLLCNYPHVWIHYIEAEMKRV